MEAVHSRADAALIRLRPSPGITSGDTMLSPVTWGPLFRRGPQETPVGEWTVKKAVLAEPKGIQRRNKINFCS